MELGKKYPFIIPKDIDGNVPDYYDYGYTKLDGMPKGWCNAFGEKMCDELAGVLKRCGKLDEYTIIEIKEKWGELRWYDSGGTSETDKIIEKYEEMSKTICVSCGKPATKISKGWINPWCNDCSELWQFEYFDIC